MLEWLNKIDTWLFLLINGAYSDGIDTIMITASGKWNAIPLYALVLYLFIRKYKMKGWRYVILVALILLLTDKISTHLFKNVFERLRPCWEPALDGLVRLPAESCGGKYGFISSHVSNTLGFAFFVSQSLKKHYKWITPLLYVWVAIVAYSRIYLGKHYPGDVLVGLMVGLLCSWLVWVVASKSKFLAGKR